MSKAILKGGMAAMAVVAVLAQATPAQAFYLHVPEALKEYIARIQAPNVFAGETETLAPPPTGGEFVPMPEPHEQPQFTDFKRGTQQMDQQMKEMEFMLDRNEQRGIPPNPDMKDRLERSKQMVGDLKSMGSPEELRNFDLSNLEKTVGDLDQDREEMKRTQQRRAQLQREVRGMEQGIKQFEKQLSRLTAQKLPIPAEISEKVAKIKAIIAAIKSAKSEEEFEAIDVESLHELMSELHEGQQELEMLFRWPQTLKQINREITQLNKDLKRAKATVDKLAKKNIDVSSFYASFEEGVKKLQAVREEAILNVAAGDAEGAFSLLEEGFFDHMDDIRENNRIIQMMSNLGRFTSEFKRGLAEGKRTITALKRQKIDTAQLETLLKDVEAKGNEIAEMVKSKDLDEEVISDALQDLENLKQEFTSLADELRGEEEERPWEGGKKQFAAPTFNTNLEKLLPPKSTEGE